ncbi:MAG: hypothetical protein HUU50_11380 [Candidatus Brocadiae bacterium]|nr:hypothetical protein [Candidatus Brocadiia bacterium]
MNKSYFLAILFPILFCIGAVVYVSSFEVPLLAQVQFSEKKVQTSEEEPVPMPSVWDKAKDRESPKDLIFALTELQKEADMQLDAEKIYKLHEFELMNVKMGEQIYKVQRLERNFYFPPSTLQQEVATLDDVEIIGIFYGNANIRVADEQKERYVKVGDTIKNGKAKVLEIRSDAVVFFMDGKKIEKPMRK